MYKELKKKTKIFFPIAFHANIINEIL
jgi:hypothetical protein